MRTTVTEFIVILVFAVVFVGIVRDIAAGNWVNVFLWVVGLIIGYFIGQRL